jgi:F-type H+-transporting ATPase subunit epsilon
MADKAFQLDIVSPESTLYQGQVTELKLPAWDGYMGVLNLHAPFLCALQTGEIYIKTVDGEERYMAVSGGFFEVSGNKAILLADTAETTDEIDVDRAKKAVERARERIKQGAREDNDLDRAQDALSRNLNRVRTVEKRV